MARYINANEIRYHQKENIDGYVYSEYVSKDEIDAIPDADVEPVRRGEWIIVHEHTYLADGTRKDWDNFFCSECYTPENAPRKFCAECGAKMGGE